MLTEMALATSLRLRRTKRASAKRNPRLRNPGPKCAASQLLFLQNKMMNFLTETVLKKSLINDEIE